MECQQQERDGDCSGLQLGNSSVDTGSLEVTILWKETRAGLWDGKRPVSGKNMLIVQAGCLPQLKTPK